MTRPSPSQARAILYGILATITAAAILGSARLASDQKLDVERFERDSITRDWHAAAEHALLLRIDSTTRRIEQRQWERRP